MIQQNNLIDKYRQHVKTLSQIYGCQLKQEDNIAGMMYVEFGYVVAPTIHNQIDYLINLHELMHFKHGDTQGRPPHNDKKHYFEAGVLHQEAYAWDEALDICIDELQDQSRYFIWDQCLGTYYKYGYQERAGKPDRLLNGNRHWVQFVYDKPDAYFTSVVKKIQGNLKDFKIKYEF